MPDAVLRGTDRRLIAAALLVAVGLSALDIAVVSTAMPTVVGQLGGIGLYSWVFSGYLLTSTVLVPIYGKLADLYGRKPLFLFSAAVFVGGSMLCGQAQSMEQLILFRFLQGAGAGGVAPITVTIVGDIFPLEQRARVMGLFSGVWTLSSILGPAIGGFLTEQVSWRWIFYVNLPLGLLSMLLVWRFLHERVERRPHSVDYAGAAYLAAGVSALLFGLQGQAGAELPRTVALLAAAAALLALFVRQEQRAPEPLLPLDLFRQRLIGPATVAAFLAGVVLFVQSSFVPPFLQGVMGATPTLGGFLLGATSLGWTTGSVVCGRFILRWGYRAAGLLGGGLLLAGSLLLATLQPDDTFLHAALTQVALGAGFGLITPATTVLVQNAVPWQRRGVVTGAVEFARTMGGTVGVSLAGALFASLIAGVADAGGGANAWLSFASRSDLSPQQAAALREPLAGALKAVYWLLVGVSALTLVPLARLPAGDPERHAWRDDADRGAERDDADRGAERGAGRGAEPTPRSPVVPGAS